MRRRLLLPVLLGLCALASAPGASAATLSFNKPCFRELSPATLSGTGFTPNGPVALGRDGSSLGFLTAGPLGGFGLTRDSGNVSSGERRYNFVAVDGTNNAISAATQLRVSALAMSVRPGGGSPSRVRRVRARGFVGGKTLYAHVRRGRGYKLRVRIGRLRGPCATVSARARLLKRGTPVGSYRVQFDARRRYSRCSRVTATRTCLVSRVRVFRIFRSSSRSASAAGTGDSWEQIVGPPSSGGPGFAKLP
ncbi:MAG: hypothetical protein M3350_01730 [Actinomycetota bacterium]|nr:hypothetical protein [Actinomycetota bacterium]MDQ3719499.1 hypothetical protein [Actinomycetota bacterium]